MLKAALIIPDCHIPFEHKKAYQLMLDVANYINPAEIVILGDYADFYCVSSHGKDPRLPSLLTEEIEGVRKRLDELDTLFPRTRKIFIEGNHEFRLERYLLNNAPALFGVTSIEHLFEINRRPLWNFKKYGPNQTHPVLGSYLYARHEPMGSSAKATAQNALCSLVYGHIHRIEESHKVGLDGTNHVAFSVGWLGDTKFDQVFNYVKSKHQWQLGFGIAYAEQGSRLFYHQKVHIIEYRGVFSCVVNGKRFSA